MALKEKSKKIYQGKDCTTEFRDAYENRYTWEPDFSGYKGEFRFSSEDKSYEGSFVLGEDKKPQLYNLNDSQVKSLVASQLFEVAIHRVRRPFETVHSQNTFTYGDIDEIGAEVIVGGKNIGDKYRIKDNVVSMVYRHIHGSLIRIYTQETINTGRGYLSNIYTSQYLDPKTKKELGPKKKFHDQFEPLYKGGPWVLISRSIEKEISSEQNLLIEKYSFFNLYEIN